MEKGNFRKSNANPAHRYVTTQTVEEEMCVLLCSLDERCEGSGIVNKRSNVMECLTLETSSKAAPADIKIWQKKREVGKVLQLIDK